ncbi:MAG TPA: protein kinase [Polyangia bacterium]|jgi:tetratricopeptide (TPR) repeat protein|nr:protein kinase [Polyangia bacterium]
MLPIIAGRFAIEREAGAGGMATVYRARDLTTGDVVALKWLSSNAAADAERFTQEAQILADLVHPAIVRYVAHGMASDWRATGPADRHPARPYLVMEWLDGHDLGARLASGPLPPGDAVAVLRRIAEGLAVAHARGVVHRDIKPENVFLPDRCLDRAKLLDFGIARLAASELRLTLTGHLIGTPGYLAPEVIGGTREVTARADVFALGCVIFHALTGRAPFHGDSVGAILTRVLTADVPRVDSLIPGLPSALGDLIAAMLARAPEDRPPDGGAVAHALNGMTLPAASAASAARREEMPSLTVGEQRIIGVVAARLGGGAPLPEAARRALEDAGGELHLEADAGGGQIWLVALPQARKATDQARGAARIARLLAAADPGAALAMATGPGQIADGVPSGGVRNDVVALLARSAPGTIRVDDLSAALLDGHFEIQVGPAGRSLRAPRAAFEARRQLLGRSGVFVGRVRELGLLTNSFLTTTGEEVGCAVLVIAPAGSGKSRLRQEFLDWVSARAEPVEVLFAAGDSVAAGSPFALLGQALRRLADIGDSDGAGERERKLRLRLGRHLEAAQAPRVLAFLGELGGVPFSDAHDPALRAARQDPQLMGDNLRRAWEDWLAAECRAHPVLLVLDDLHWSDAGTVSLIDAALRRARDLPLMVLASARPEVDKTFPQIWSERQVQLLRLGPLSRKAAEALIRDALGAGIGDAIVARLIERADGNPFYLEELIRATHEGRHDQLPDSVLGMVQARLDAEPADARRVLRAASVFGERFSAAGVSALLGGPERADEVAVWLRHLSARELVRAEAPPAADEGGGATENVEVGRSVFTHALIREAAYAMLTPEDQVLGHRLAGLWWAQSPFPDPLVVAEHLRRGGLPEQAAAWYEQAAIHALASNDLGAAIERAAVGLEALAAMPAEARRDQRAAGARLRLVQAEAHLWRGEHAETERAAGEAAGALEPGSARWLRAAAHAIIAVGRQGKLDEMDAWVAQVTGVLPDAGARGALTISLAWASIFLVFGGRFDAADELMAAVADLAGEGADGADPQAIALLHQARSARASTRGDLGACLASTEAALAAFERAGDERNACTARANVAFVYGELGDVRRAEEVLRGALASAERMGLADVRAIILHNLGRVVGLGGDLAQAEQIEREALTQLERQGEPRLEGLARTYLAAILTAAGRTGEAIEQAQRAVVSLEPVPGLRALALATLAAALAAAGQPQAALEAARSAFAALEALGTLEEGEAEIRLRYADCLREAGQGAEAQAVLIAAHDQLLARAARIADLSWRQRFLNDVPVNARTLALAQAGSPTG